MQITLLQHQHILYYDGEICYIAINRSIDQNQGTDGSMLSL